ncbi:iron complex outermembrane recepter protein [Sphingopyxis sp. YR583]|uniref:TonB-dependent receptor n=1 Tax=Sphingopyxis sp. YR583 TaxID=1881047 RepID=UPI0008A7712D|nr:TonB-dependent receptor [Sphingopyxis sp. YR583]SEH17246.1 iron complex outermembrane recepter protein [Sphingopyxis sp. YR583]
MNRFSPDHHLKLLLGAALLLPAGPAFAAETAAEESSGAADSTADESAAGAAVAAASAASYDGAEIIVSARRRDESAQDVPIALSVVGASQLEATGNYSLTQIQQIVPSLQVFSFNPRNTNINIRGLGSNVALTNDGLENGVGFYVDNVYYGRPGQSQFDLVDLQQIEVLRGPQGTLFGKNTTSGAINITSRKPSFNPEFSGEASVGDYGYYQLRASASGAIIDDLLAIRISGSSTERRGFLYNDTQKERAQDYSNWSVRGQLLFTPTPNLEARIIGDFSRQKQNHVLNVFADYFGTYENGAAIPNSFAERAARFPGYSFPTIDPFARRGEADSHYQSNMDGYGVSGQLDWDVGAVKLTSITAYRWWDWNPSNDGDSTSLPVIVKAQQANRQRQFSQEIRLASDTDGPIDYVVGAYYFWQIIRGKGASAYGPAAGLWNRPATSPIPLTAWDAALNGFEANSTSDPRTKSYALFGQLDWKFTDRLTLTAGLRYTHEKKSGSFTQIHVAGTNLATLPAGLAAQAAALRAQFNPVTSYSTGFTDNSVSGLATLSWQFSDNALAYATYSRGNKSGGLNLTNLPAGIDPDVAPEKVDSYELGIKSQWFDKAVTLNVAGYWTEISDYQTAITEQVPNTVNVRQYIANIPGVRSRGVEGDLSYAPSDRASFYASIAYADTTYSDYRTAPQAPERLNQGGIQDLTGEQLPGVPKLTYTLGGDVSAPLGNLGGRDLSLYGHADYSHRSTFNTSSSDSRYADVTAYGIANARIGIRTDDGLFDLSLWARNLFDKDYFQTLSAQNTGIVTSLIGEPRTIGATMRTKL